jgi:hypothetical protein
MPPAVTLYTRVPTHYRGELPEIASDLQAAVPDVKVVVDEPHVFERAGVTYAEVLNVVVPIAEGYLFGKVADAAIGVVRANWEKKRRDNPNQRPRYVNILGPDGKIVCSVRIPPEETDPTFIPEHER